MTARLRGIASRLTVALTLATAWGCTSYSAFPLPFYHGAQERPATADRTAARPAPPPRQAGNGLDRAALLKFGAARSDTLLVDYLALPDVPGTAPLIDGNDVQLLVDGPATFDAMFAAVDRARRSIDIQTYIFDDNELGRKMADLLARKRAQGLRVRLIYDSVGSVTTPSDFFDGISATGVGVCEFNPVNPAKSLKIALNHRGHRKILVADHDTAFAGGINVSSVYSSGSASPVRQGSARSGDPAREGWRDTHIQVRGPAALEFERLFEETWRSQQCDEASSRRAARAAPADRESPVHLKTRAAAEAPAGLATRAIAEPRANRAVPRRGNQIVQVIGSSPEDQANQIYIEMLSALRTAKRSIRITMAYFVPDEQTLKLLADAAGRGVDVQLILPGFSDAALVLDAGRAHYKKLLDAGVKLYERKDALLHAKTIVIDGIWSMIGSTNMDWRSFVHNDEVSAVVLDQGFAAQMEALFTRDLERATPIDREQWARRGPIARIKELWSSVWAYWL